MAYACMHIPLAGILSKLQTSFSQLYALCTCYIIDRLQPRPARGAWTGGQTLTTYSRPIYHVCAKKLFLNGLL